MAVSFIPKFAEYMTPSLADLAGQCIVSARDGYASDGKAESHRDVMEMIFESWKTKYQDTVISVGNDMFLPLSPWSAETAMEAGRLLFNAFAYAIEQREVWDRRLSPNSVSHKVRAGIWNTYAIGRMNVESIDTNR